LAVDWHQTSAGRSPDTIRFIKTDLARIEHLNYFFSSLSYVMPTQIPAGISSWLAKNGQKPLFAVLADF
jgi:hypothetical protein